MALQVHMAGETGSPVVSVTQGRGLNADELTDMAMAKIIFVGENAPPAVREQATAYAASVRRVVHYYLVQAQKSERTTICNILTQCGQHAAAALLEKL